MKTRQEILDEYHNCIKQKDLCKMRLECGSPRNGDKGLYDNLKIQIRTYKWVLGIR